MKRQTLLTIGVCVVWMYAAGATVMLIVSLAGCSSTSPSRAWIDASGQHSVSHIYNPRTHRIEAVER